MKRIPLSTGDGKVGGVIVDGILTKNIRMSVHALRNPPALAIDASILAQAEALGVVQIAITDTEAGRAYRAALSDLYRHGWKFDRGYGVQYAMRLTRWAVDGKPLQPASPAAAEPDAGQLALEL